MPFHFPSFAEEASVNIRIILMEVLGPGVASEACIWTQASRDTRILQTRADEWRLYKLKQSWSGK